MNLSKMADHTYPELMISGDQDTDLLSFAFNTPQQNQILKVDDISKPLPVIMVQKNPCLTMTKKQSIGSKLLLGFTTPSNIGISKSQQTIGRYKMLPQPDFVNEQNQENGQTVEVQDNEIMVQDYEGSLIIDDHKVQTEGYNLNSGIPYTCTPEILMADSEVLNLDRDDEVDAMSQYLKSGENPTEFVAVSSEKRRNPPYLIGDSTKITTKNEEPVKFCLQGAKVYQVIMVTMRFSEEKYKNSPVIACPIHRKDDIFNFVVSTKENAKCGYDSILQHPTAHLTLEANNIDLWGNFNFFISFRCLNSCHKENGKKMEIIFKVMEQEKLLQERQFEVRVCKNVKRDYKEAFQGEETSVDKRVKPESLIHQEQVQNDSSISQKEVKPVTKKQNEVRVHMIRPCEEEPKARETTGLVKCIPAKKPEVPKPKFYLIQLPTVEKEKNILETVRLFGGSVLDLESVCPVEAPEEESDDP